MGGRRSSVRTVRGGHGAPQHAEARAAMQLASDKYAALTTHRGGWGWIINQLMARGDLYVGEPVWKDTSFGTPLFVDFCLVMLGWRAPNPNPKPNPVVMLGWRA